MRDRTDRKRLDEELRHRAEALARADQEKDEFLAVLAHELRNPLAPIAYALHLLDEKPLTTPPASTPGASSSARWAGWRG